MQRMTAVVRRQRPHLIRCHGALAPNARPRTQLAPPGPQEAAKAALEIAVQASRRESRRLAAANSLALGTDWSPSGSLSLLDEAHCLAGYSRDSLQGRLIAAELHAMMTSAGARAVALQGQVGALAPGEWADLVLFDTEGRRTLGEHLDRSALPQALAVMVGGRIASAPLARAGRLPQLVNCAPPIHAPCVAYRDWCAARIPSARSKSFCYGVSSHLLDAVARAESDGDPTAVNLAHRSRTGT